MIEDYKKVAIQAAKEAGDILLRNFRNKLQLSVETKKKFDFVTRVDKESEAKVIEIIKNKYPDHKIFAEETKKDLKGKFRWIIDPLDGTTNYIHGVPIFTVSIALECDGEIVLGVVYDPVHKELFFGEKGKGAFLNDNPIKVSDVENPEFGLLATGFPFRVKHLINPYQESFAQLFHSFSGIRRAGSAALDLCYVACGRFDGFWELDLKPWDLAASYIIIKEAGGQITDFDGQDEVLVTGNTIASNGKLYEFMLSTIKGVFAGIVDK